jgi:hypothetical protein
MAKKNKYKKEVSEDTKAIRRFFNLVANYMNMKRMLNRE